MDRNRRFAMELKTFTSDREEHWDLKFPHRFEPTRKNADRCMFSHGFTFYGSKTVGLVTRAGDQQMNRSGHYYWGQKPFFEMAGIFRPCPSPSELGTIELGSTTILSILV